MSAMTFKRRPESREVITTALDARHPLAQRILAWREDDQAGYDAAIALLCEAEEELDGFLKLWQLLHWSRSDVQPPSYYTDEQKDGWRQAMAQARTILSFYSRGITKLP